MHGYLFSVSNSLHLCWYEAQEATRAIAKEAQNKNAFLVCFEGKGKNCHKNCHRFLLLDMIKHYKIRKLINPSPSLVSFQTGKCTLQAYTKTQS